MDEDGKLVYLLSNGQALNWANKHGIKGNGRPTKCPAREGSLGYGEGRPGASVGIALGAVELLVPFARA